MATLTGSQVCLRPASREHLSALVAIRETPEVRYRWRGGDDMEAAVLEDLDDPDSTPYVIEVDGRVVGWIQWSAEESLTTGTRRLTSMSIPWSMAGALVPMPSGPDRVAGRDGLVAHLGRGYSADLDVLQHWPDSGY